MSSTSSTKAPPCSCSSARIEKREVSTGSIIKRAGEFAYNHIIKHLIYTIPGKVGAFLKKEKLIVLTALLAGAAFTFNLTTFGYGIIVCGGFLKIIFHTLRFLIGKKLRKECAESLEDYKSAIDKFKTNKNLLGNSARDLAKYANKLKKLIFKHSFLQRDIPKKIWQEFSDQLKEIEVDKNSLIDEFLQEVEKMKDLWKKEYNGYEEELKYLLNQDKFDNDEDIYSTIETLINQINSFSRKVQCLQTYNKSKSTLKQDIKCIYSYAEKESLGWIHFKIELAKWNDMNNKLLYTLYQSFIDKQFQELNKKFLIIQERVKNLENFNEKDFKKLQKELFDPINEKYEKLNGFIEKKGKDIPDGKLLLKDFKGMLSKFEILFKRCNLECVFIQQFNILSSDIESLEKVIQNLTDKDLSDIDIVISYLERMFNLYDEFQKQYVEYQKEATKNKFWIVETKNYFFQKVNEFTNKLESSLEKILSKINPGNRLDIEGEIDESKKMADISDSVLKSIFINKKNISTYIRALSQFALVLLTNRSKIGNFINEVAENIVKLDSEIHSAIQKKDISINSLKTDFEKLISLYSDVMSVLKKIDLIQEQLDKNFLTKEDKENFQSEVEESKKLLKDFKKSIRAQLKNNQEQLTSKLEDIKKKYKCLEERLTNLPDTNLRDISKESLKKLIAEINSIYRSLSEIQKNFPADKTIFKGELASFVIELENKNKLFDDIKNMKEKLMQSIIDQTQILDNCLLKNLELRIDQLESDKLQDYLDLLQELLDILACFKKFGDVLDSKIINKNLKEISFTLLSGFYHKHFKDFSLIIDLIFKYHEKIVFPEDTASSSTSKKMEEKANKYILDIHAFLNNISSLKEAGNISEINIVEKFDRFIELLLDFKVLEMNEKDIKNDLILSNINAIKNNFFPKSIEILNSLVKEKKAFLLEKDENKLSEKEKEEKKQLIKYINILEYLHLEYPVLPLVTKG